MDIIYYLFAGAAGVAGALASLAIWAPRVTRVRMTAVVLTAAFIPLVYVQMLEMLSKPKPMGYEWYHRTSDQVVVLGAHFDEGQVIYLWLGLPDRDEPRYYAIPWNIKLAERLQDGLEDAVRSDSVLVIEDPFRRRSLEEWGDLNMQIKPPPLPPQKLPKFPPRIIDPREFKI